MRCLSWCFKRAPRFVGPHVGEPFDAKHVRHPPALPRLSIFALSLASTLEHTDYVFGSRKPRNTVHPFTRRFAGALREAPAKIAQVGGKSLGCRPRWGQRGTETRHRSFSRVSWSAERGCSEVVAVVASLVLLPLLYYLASSKLTSKATVLFATTASVGMMVMSMQNLGLIGMMTLLWQSPTGGKCFSCAFPKPPVECAGKWSFQGPLHGQKT